MARTARRYEKKEAAPADKRVYRGGVYVRLSCERSESWREKSSSPKVQFEVCSAYAKKEGIEVCELYEDYEYSGTNFERPAYRRMMDDVRKGKINCILVRDLSRLGREHIEMGRLVDKVFPFLGVRFVSVDDKVDTAHGLDSKKSFEVMLKNIINDFYSKDISTKVIASKRIKASNGYFIGSDPPYGYRIVRERKGRKLVPDENTAPVVKHIFEMALSGMTQNHIVMQLNRENLSPPRVYHRTGRVMRQEGDTLWNCNGLWNIITNISYTGTLVQGKVQQSLASGEKKHRTDESEHIVCENAHEAIIPREMFDEVQRIRKKAKADSNFSRPKLKLKKEPENRYKGFIFFESKQNGNEMRRAHRIIYLKDKKPYIEYLFTTKKHDYYSRDYSVNPKPKIVIVTEKEVDRRVKDEVASMLSKAGVKKKYFTDISSHFISERNKANERKNRLLKKIKDIEVKRQKLYEKYALDKNSDRDSYLLKREELQRNEETLKTLILEEDAALSELGEEEKAAMDRATKLFRKKTGDKPGRELILSLLDSVIIMSKEDIRVNLKPVIRECGGDKDE